MIKLVYRKFILTFILLGLLVILAANVNATFNPALRLNYVVLEKEFVQPGDTFFVIVKTENHGPRTYSQLRLKIEIPELEVAVTSAEYKLSKYDREFRKSFVTIPGNVKPGSYVMKITVGNDEVKRVKYRYVTVI